jgi:diguanylate cyclase (GGDEF)-like protein
MMSVIHPGDSRRFLSLRWKAVIGLSAVLVLINTSLAFFSYQELAQQFERKQEGQRERQTSTLKALVADGYRQLSRLANVVPLLVPTRPDQSLAAHLSEALNTNGVMLDLEWDVRTVDWIRPGGDIQPLWPPNSGLPQAEVAAALGSAVTASPEQTVRLLDCSSHCRQLLAAPLLWEGEPAGALLLGRSVADVLLAFNALTDAEVALVTRDLTSAEQPVGGRFRAITHPEHSRELFESALNPPTDQNEEQRTDEQQPDDRPNRGTDGGPAADSPRPVIRKGEEWYQLFRIANLAPGIDALVLNRITAERRAIREATRNSITLAVLGFLASETLLLLIMRIPLRRLRRLSDRLPLLAEGRFSELRAALPGRSGQPIATDEIDLIHNTVRRLTNRMEDSEKQREIARAELVWLADHDPLTRLQNRRRFDMELRRVLHTDDQTLAHGALLFLDLDQFKDVNDISGHQIGDQLLRHVAEKLLRCLDEPGKLGRLGGDEFGVILPGADAEQATRLATQLLDEIKDVMVQTRLHRHRVSASVGIVLYPEHGSDPVQLLADADLAMYQAKNAGRSCWHVFSPEDDGRERANARVIWAERISSALRDDCFKLLLQPILDIASGRVVYAEALIRMVDPDGSLVPPFSFIPVAEETGQIYAIDHWVIADAIALMGRRPGLALSVNLSANSLRDDTLLLTLDDLLRRHAVDPSRLTLEITETAAINSLSSAAQLIEQIHQLGCRFALDDFGTGFASYAYLRQLPVDAVKIDGAFIRNLAFSKEDQIFVRAITEMAHNMNRQVVAEFVDKQNILDVLAELGVDYAQGYHIGRPGPVEDLIQQGPRGEKRAGAKA